MEKWLDTCKNPAVHRKIDSFERYNQKLGWGLKGKNWLRETFFNFWSSFSDQFQSVNIFDGTILLES